MTRTRSSDHTVVELKQTRVSLFLDRMVTTFWLDGNNTEESIFYSIIEYHERDIKVSIQSFFHQGMPVLLLSLIGVDAINTIMDYL